MAQVATLTIGADTFSVYGLTSDALADANSYFAGRLGASAWTGATDDTKKQALVTAVRFLDRGVTWSGEQTDTVTPQPLQWPRDGATCNGEAVTDGTTPDNIALGEFELALALLEDEAIQDSAGAGSNVKRAKAGPAEVEFFVPTAGTSSETRFPQPVHELVSCYTAGAAVIANPYVNGVNSPANDDQDSSFCSESNNFDYMDGLP